MRQRWERADIRGFSDVDGRIHVRAQLREVAASGSEFHGFGGWDAAVD